MSDKELFEKYAEICDHRQRRLMDVQETALFCALRDMLKRGAKLAELVNGPTQLPISHDDWYALRNECDALRAKVKRLRKDAERRNKTIQRLMLRLADLLQDDDFNTLEQWVIEAGFTYPPIDANLDGEKP